VNQIQRNHVIPVTHQQVLKFDSLLGTDPPALAAARTLGHVVLQCSLFVLIAITQSRSRTIFHTT
jgi:hypothetical protein